MNYNEKRVGIYGIWGSNRTLEYRLILASYARIQSIGPVWAFPLNSWHIWNLDACFLFYKLADNFLVCYCALSLSFGKSPLVLLGSRLSSSSSNGIVMLENAQGIHEAITWFVDLINLFPRSLLIYGLLCKYFIVSMQFCWCIFYLLFQARSWGEVAGPKILHPIWPIREEITLFNGPSHIFFFESVHILLRCWVNAR